jgi:hypothetical protein
LSEDSQKSITTAASGNKKLKATPFGIAAPAFRDSLSYHRLDVRVEAE